MLFDPLAAVGRIPKRFREQLRRAIADPPRGMDDWFLRYWGHLAEDRGLATYVRTEEQQVSLVGGVRGKDVLDAGSGFGITSSLLAVWGARRVISVEIHRPMVESHRRLLAERFTDLGATVHPVRGDVGRLPVDDSSMDLVLSVEAISHYYDVPHFLDECRRVLRPGGHLLVSDGNNGSNPHIRAETEELWERLEQGPKGRWMSHEITDTHVERRERIIREAFPAIEAARVKALAEATSNYDRAQIVREVAAHLAGGPAPSSHYQRGTCPREPVWGYWVEWLFDPRELGRDIARRGFDVKVIPHYGGARNDWILAANLVLRAVPSFRYARAFRIVARRQALGA